ADALERAENFTPGEVAEAEIGALLVPAGAAENSRHDQSTGGAGCECRSHPARRHRPLQCPAAARRDWHRHAPVPTEKHFTSWLTLVPTARSRMASCTRIRGPPRTTPNTARASFAAYASAPPISASHSSITTPARCSRLLFLGRKVDTASR